MVETVSEKFLTSVPVEYRALSPANVLNSKQRRVARPWILQNETMSANVPESLRRETYK